MLLFIASGALAQNLFVRDVISGDIDEFTPNGAQSTFASGLTLPSWLMTFNSAGTLFTTSSTNIIEITPDGKTNIFASGLTPDGLAFNNAGILFEADHVSGNIYEFTTNGVQSTFASNLDEPTGLAFQPVPQLLGTGANGAFQLSITLSPGYYYSTIVQASTNLANWCDISTNTPPFAFTDSMAAELPYRFYRVQLAR